MAGLSSLRLVGVVFALAACDPNAGTDAGRGETDGFISDAGGFGERGRSDGDVAVGDAAGLADAASALLDAAPEPPDGQHVYWQQDGPISMLSIAPRLGVDPGGRNKVVAGTPLVLEVEYRENSGHDDAQEFFHDVRFSEAIVTQEGTTFRVRVVYDVIDCDIAYTGLEGVYTADVPIDPLPPGLYEFVAPTPPSYPGYPELRLTVESIGAPPDAGL